MTDLERISHYRRRLVLFNPVGLLMLVAAIFLRARFFPDAVSYTHLTLPTTPYV